MAFNGNGPQAAEQVEAVTGKGWKFSIDIDTPLAPGKPVRTSRKSLIEHLKEARADWTYQIVTLKSEGLVVVTENRHR